MSYSASASFSLFSNLPPELRLRVWQHNLPPARLVPIRIQPRSPYGNAPSGCLSTAQVPTNLHVCGEARNEATKHYSLSFGICGEGGQVFFNPVHDILYFGSRDGFMETEAQFHQFLSMVEPDQLAQVRRVAINDAIFWPQPEYISSIAARLTIEIITKVRSRFPNLEELVFVPKDDNPVYAAGQGAALVEPPFPDHRLLRQIHEGMQIIAQSNPSLGSPNWSVKVLSSNPEDKDTSLYTTGCPSIEYERHDFMEGIEPTGPDSGRTAGGRTGSGGCGRRVRLTGMDKGILRCFS